MDIEINKAGLYRGDVAPFCYGRLLIIVVRVFVEGFVEYSGVFLTAFLWVLRYFWILLEHSQFAKKLEVSIGVVTDGTSKSVFLNEY